MYEWYCIGCETWFEVEDKIVEPYCPCCGQQEHIVKYPY